MHEATPTANLFVRSLQPSAAGACQRRVVDCLQSLHEAGVLADVELTVWGRQVPRDGPIAETDTAATIAEAVAAMREWAADAGVALGGLFEERLVDNGVTGEAYAATVLPAMVLVERAGSDVQFVAPHEREDGTYTVDDRLAHLATEAGVSAGHPDGDVPATAG